MSGYIERDVEIGLYICVAADYRVSDVDFLCNLGKDVECLVVCQDLSPVVYLQVAGDDDVSGCLDDVVVLSVDQVWSVKVEHFASVHACFRTYNKVVRVDYADCV